MAPVRSASKVSATRGRLLGPCCTTGISVVECDSPGRGSLGICVTVGDGCEARVGVGAASGGLSAQAVSSARPNTTAPSRAPRWTVTFAEYAVRQGRDRAYRLAPLPAGEPDDLVAGLAAFTHGLVVQALFDPRAFPRRRLLALLDAQLDALTAAGSGR